MPLRRSQLVLSQAAAVLLGISALGAGIQVAQAAAASSSAHVVGRHVYVTSPAADAPTGAGMPADIAGGGLVYRGLRLGAATACDHAFAASTHVGVACTHGPDPAPAGAFPQVRRTPAELAESTTSSTTTSGTATALPCFGDGVSGPRVQVIYAHAADTADNYASVAPLIPQWMANVDATFNDSAAQTGGVRHVLWLTDSSCNLSVDDVTLSTTGDDSFTNTMNELQSVGYSRTDRKYIVLVDANIYCGIGTVKGDDQAGSANANNTGPSYARVDNGCWGQAAPVEAHELMHTLGGVQLSAPHSSGGWHCTDESDRMCYADSASTVLTFPCDQSNERLFDCGHDDYYNTAPVANSYLATHWDAANSVFLATTDPGAAPTASPTPTAMSSTSYSGSLSRKNRVNDHALTTGAGLVTAKVSFTKATSLTVVIKNGAGQQLASATGASPVTVSVQVAAGSTVVELTSPGYPQFTANVSYPSP